MRKFAFAHKFEIIQSVSDATHCIFDIFPQKLTLLVYCYGMDLHHKFTNHAMWLGGTIRIPACTCAYCLILLAVVLYRERTNGGSTTPGFFTTTFPGTHRQTSTTTFIGSTEKVFDEPIAMSASPPRIRSEFPETWIWVEIEIAG